MDWCHYLDIESTTASSSFLSFSSSSCSMVSLYVCTAEQEMSQEGHSALRPFSYTQHCYVPCLFLETSNNMSPRQILGQSWGAVYLLGGIIIKSTYFPNASIPNSHSCWGSRQVAPYLQENYKNVASGPLGHQMWACGWVLCYMVTCSLSQRELDQDWGCFK